MPLYRVTVLGVYHFLKREDNITAARAWAKQALPKERATVQRERAYRFCWDCHSAPCCCAKGKR